MKTTYYLVAVAAVAVAVGTIYSRLTGDDPSAPPRQARAAEPPREVPRLALPPVTLPPDEPTPPETLPIADAKQSVPSGAHVALASGTEPALPMVPALPAIASARPNVEPLVSPTIPAVAPITPMPKQSDAPPVVAPTPPPLKPVAPTVVPTIPSTPTPPTTTQTPTIPTVPPVASVTPLPPPVKPLPVTPLPPTPAPSPVLQPPVSPTPNTLPPLGSDSPPPAPPAAGAADEGKYVVLKDDKLIEASAVSLRGDTVFVRQGVLDRPFHKSQVQHVASSKDEVYKFMLAKVPEKDAAARLGVARWCMFSGMREQALTEAREVQKLQPGSTAAADMVRALELSLRQFPPANAAKMTLPEQPVFTTELREPKPIPPSTDSDPDVTPEAALVFGSRVQPILANQCVECHARPDYAGAFKLARVTPTEAGREATRANLRATAAQLKKDEPASSPLLVKSLTAHGGMKQPAIASRYAAAYMTLEGWASLALGVPIAAPPTSTASVPTLPVPQPQVVSQPVVAPTTPVVPPVAATESVLPPVPMVAPPVSPPVVNPMPLAVPPVLPPTPVTLPTADPMLPPAVPVAPAQSPPVPVSPMIPPVTTPALPPVEVITPTLPPAPQPRPVPAIPPVVPPTDTGAKPVLPPAIPPIPPAAVAPKSPSPVVPTGGTQFGVTQPPKPPVTGPGGDEFDPQGFNRK